MIQALEDMIRQHCYFGIEYKDTSRFVHNWVSLLPALEFANNSSEKEQPTKKILFELEQGYTPMTPHTLLNHEMG